MRVESQTRLDEVMLAVTRRIGRPQVADPVLRAEGQRLLERLRRGQASRSDLEEFLAQVRPATCR